jgi:O-antigen/teichoic acid export membrane protein
MKALRAGAVYLVANLVAAGVPFLLLPLLTRLLTPSEYGQVVNYFLLMSACSAVAGLNVHGAVGVAWFRHERADLPFYVGSALSIGMLSSLAVAALLAAALAIFMPLSVSPSWGAIAAIAAGCNVLLQCRLVLWQNQHDPLPMAGLQILSSVCNVGLSLLAVLWLDWGGLGRNAGAATASVLMAILAVTLLLSSGLARLALRRGDIGKLLAFGIPLIPHALAGVLLSSADRFAVSAEMGPQALGIYGAGAQLGAVMAILADAFSKAFSPWMYERLDARQAQDQLRAVGAVYASAPALLLIAACTGALLLLGGSILLGPAYSSALELLPWFMLGGAFTGMYLAVSGLYFFHGRTALLSSISVPAALIGAALTFAFVTRFGLTGAAVGYATTQLLLAGGAWIVATRSFDLPWRRVRAALRACWEGARRAPAGLTP